MTRDFANNGLDQISYMLVFPNEVYERFIKT
jgi:hypothetical protein